MELLKKKLEEQFGQQFIVDFSKKGVTLIAKDKSHAFCMGFTYYLTDFRFREKLIVLKRFEEVEKLLQPILKKYKIGQGDFVLAVYDCGFFSTIKELIPFKNIPTINHPLISDSQDISLEDEVQIENALFEIKKAIEYAKVHFVDKYQTINDVFEATKKMNEDQIADFFPPPGSLRKIMVSYYSNQNFQLDTEMMCQIQIDKSVEIEYPDIFKNYAEATEALYEKLKSLGKS
ncbi:hypothetical protein [Runella sp. SP2]|uniref:hypothetical protein n=1 Tax=Runella sp. SP2 TaxID=2268026 RepID=UPI000F0882EE|nr:hypothetical protein [Runella sp. SP2]AYQ32161.1 hypothetical protein DTQ70_08220 [Runella sp. SP2]